MGHLIKVEQYGIDHKLEDSQQYSVPGWEGIWRAVEEEMDRTGKTPSGMEGWEEGGCVLGPEHDCDGTSEQCRQNLKDAIREWIESAWGNDELRTGSFHFAGADWSSVTFNWDGN